MKPRFCFLFFLLLFTVSTTSASATENIQHANPKTKHVTLQEIYRLAIEESESIKRGITGVGESPSCGR